jgi:hypothetical protein
MQFFCRSVGYVYFFVEVAMYIFFVEVAMYDENYFIG